MLLAAQSGAGGASFGVARMEGLYGPGNGAAAVLTLSEFACQAGLRAQFLADGTMMETARVPMRGVGQRLYLTLTRPDVRKIVSITVIVEGWTPKGRLQKAAAGAESPSARGQQRLMVPLKAESDTAATGELWAPGLSAVDAVELVSIQFRKGSKWSPAAGESCRVAPEGNMRIAER